jgi:hypothetical protein
MKALLAPAAGCLRARALPQADRQGPRFGSDALTTCLDSCQAGVQPVAVKLRVGPVNSTHDGCIIGEQVGQMFFGGLAFPQRNGVAANSVV